jgi:hypothetical protein
MIDSFGDLNGSLYVASQAGVMASTVVTPRPYSSFPGDWAVATPAAWSSISSRTTTKLADLEPVDRAVPQMASLGGQLFLGRNTILGPQLWSCNPALGTAIARCEPGDWSLVAPNSSGNTQLTQFDDSSLLAITMVVATNQFLYVGFDSPNGVHVFRTSLPNASTRADFEGTGGCSADQHPASCSGIGGPGIGVATDTRILDGKAITGGGGTSVWMTVGNASNALRLVVLP